MNMTPLHHRHTGLLTRAEKWTIALAVVLILIVSVL
jgi:hypothetical protein